MFQPENAVRLSIPMWHAVYQAKIHEEAYAIIAVHDVTRGLALGGCRMQQYPDLSQALTDVLRLSRGMTFKNAIANLPLGGGKSVIICDPTVSGDKREAILEGFGAFLDWVNAQEECYLTAEDMNTTVADMHVVKRKSRYINGIDVDPSPYTAWGVFRSIAYATDYFADDLFAGQKGLRGKKVLVQGLGKVGTTLVDYLHREGADLFVSDIRKNAVNETCKKYPGTTAVPAEGIFDVDVDIFAPCAGGELVTRKTIDKLRFKLLCGAANNQLQNSAIGAQVQEKGIVYCPDYIANMGGVCAIQFMEIDKLSHDACLDKIKESVEFSLGNTFKAAFENNLPFGRAVDFVVKTSVWGSQNKSLAKSNHDIFPKASQNL